MFSAWLKANKKYPKAKSLTYVEFPTKFVYKANLWDWCPRKAGFSIGRMYYTLPESGEVYYLRTQLNLIKGPTSYEDIRIVGEVVYETYNDHVMLQACLMMTKNMLMELLKKVNGHMLIIYVDFLEHY